MKNLEPRVFALSTIIAFLFAPLVADGAQLNLVTVPDATIAPSASASGDSSLPIATPDGRYVLFASTAANLAAPLNTNAVPPQLPLKLNVYRRDRLSGTTVLASVNLSGISRNGDSIPTGISSDGRYALFESTASDLVLNDTNSANDVFIRDLVEDTTMLVSVNTNGVCGNNAPIAPTGSTMTPDGRYVAFVSAANDLAADDTNGIPDIFVRDLQAGTTTLVSGQARATLSTIPSQWSSSLSPAITPDGRYVVFTSSATNLVPGVATTGEIYLYDRLAQTTVRVSADAHTIFQSIFGGANVISFNHSLSADGSFVAYEVCTNVGGGAGLVLRYNVLSSTTDIISSNAYVPPASVSGVSLEPVVLDYVHDLDMTSDGRFVAFVANIGNALTITNTAVYLWDAQTGTNTLVSADQTSGLPAVGTCDSPVISSNGQFVAFISNGTNLCATPISGGFHLYVRDMLGGTTVLADVNTNGSGSGLNPTAVGALSADGLAVLFESSQADLVAGDGNRASDIFRRDLVAGTNELVSVRDPALPSQTPDGFNTLSPASVSSDGRYVAFASEADNLVHGGTAIRNIYVRDTLLGTNILVSVDTNGLPAGAICDEPSISANGRYVAFSSAATNLTTLDTNQYRDVFVRDLQAGTTALVSVNMTGDGAGTNDSYSPTLSSDGRFVLFRSRAQNLAPNASATDNLYLRDLQLGSTYLLTLSSIGLSPTAAAMTPDGHYVAYVDSGRSQTFVWDSLAATRISTNSASGLTVGISPDGSRVAIAGPSLVIEDVAANTNATVASGPKYSMHSGLQFSADGRFLAYSVQSPALAVQEVYVYDWQSGTSSQVSQTYYSETNGNASPADWATISPDGRFVAYRSWSSNSVPNDFNSMPDLFIYDRVNGATALVTPNQAGSAAGTANNGSLLPIFTSNGQKLLFQSWASDIASSDFNNAGDIFSLDLATWPVIGGLGSTNQTSFYAQLVPPGLLGPGPTVAWPLSPATGYQVQFKDNLSDSLWQNVNGDLIYVGGVGYISDLAPGLNQRFYRVLLNP